MCAFSPETTRLAESVDLVFAWKVFPARQGGVRNGKRESEVRLSAEIFERCWRGRASTILSLYPTYTWNIPNLG
jgi:hypothetical protein